MQQLEDEESINLNESLTRIVGFVGRRRWWILLPFCTISVAVIAFLMMLPNRYTSTATLLVVQQQVPQRYVVPNSTTDVTSALQAMKQEVLSRTQLLRMINDFALYPKQRKRKAPEELVSLMASNIDIVPINENPQRIDKDFDTFRISFTTENALLAQQVTNTLTSLFINEYLRSGTEQSANTTNFLHLQVEEKGKLLQTQEDKLRDFKMRYVGELPEQAQGNLGILGGLQQQLSATMANQSRAQQQRSLLQAQLDATPRRRPVTDAGSPVAVVPGTPAPVQIPTSIETAQNELNRLQAAQATMLSKGYTSEHPDILRNKRQIAQAQDTLRRLRAALSIPEPPRPATTTATAPRTPVYDPSDDPVVTQLKASLEANRIELESFAADERRLKASIAQYENRLNQSPVREQQQGAIVRDTEVLRQQYSELQKKEQESQLATNLEKQQGGQQFRLIDPASLPAVPSSPQRLKMSFSGTAAGLFLGLLLGFFMELRDTSYRTEKELTRHLSPPFVMGIPMLPTPMETRRRQWRNTIQWIAASVMLFVVMVAELYVYKRG